MNPFGWKDDKYFYLISAIIVLYLTAHKMAGKGWEDLLKFMNGVVLTTARSISAVFTGGSLDIKPVDQEYQRRYEKRKKDYNRRKRGE